MGKAITAWCPRRWLLWLPIPKHLIGLLRGWFNLQAHGPLQLKGESALAAAQRAAITPCTGEIDAAGFAQVELEHPNCAQPVGIASWGRCTRGGGHGLGWQPLAQWFASGIVEGADPRDSGVQQVLLVADLEVIGSGRNRRELLAVALG